MSSRPVSRESVRQHPTLLTGSKEFVLDCANDAPHGYSRGDSHHQEMYRQLASFRESLKHEVRSEARALSCQLEEVRAKLQESLELLFAPAKRHQRKGYVTTGGFNHIRASQFAELPDQRSVEIFQRTCPLWNGRPKRRKDGSHTPPSIAGGFSPEESVTSEKMDTFFSKANGCPEQLPNVPDGAQPTWANGHGTVLDEKEDAAHVPVPTFGSSQSTFNTSQSSAMLAAVRARQASMLPGDREDSDSADSIHSVKERLRASLPGDAVLAPSSRCSKCYDEEAARPQSRQIQREQSHMGSLFKTRLSLAMELGRAKTAEAELYRAKTKGLDANFKSPSKSRTVVLSNEGWGKITVAAILRSVWFDNFIGLVILSNAMTIGLQCNAMASAQTDVPPEEYQIFEYIFLALFSFELSMRVWVDGRSFWLPWPACSWNWFDAFVVIVQWVEVLLEVAFKAAAGPDELSHLHVTRILRLMRILRVMRVLRLITELRTIMSSIIGSMRSLIWTVVLLFLMIYIVGIYFVQTLANHLSDLSDSSADTSSDELQMLQDSFGTLPDAILSLYQATSGGMDWDNLSGPLIREIGWLHGLAFSLYIAFAILALMNVVTGVFVQTALQSANKEEQVFLTEQIVQLFSHTPDGKKYLTWDEVEAVTKNPTVEKEWKTIDVSAQEARFLFQLLDINSTQTVDFEEFLAGCLRLHGDAKAIDMLTLMQEFRSYTKSWAVWSAMLQDRIGWLAKSMETVREGLSPVNHLTAAVGEIRSHLKTLEMQMTTWREERDAQRDLMRSIIRLLGKSRQGR